MWLACSIAAFSASARSTCNAWAASKSCSRVVNVASSSDVRSS
eukprot:CAMPEP_0182846416 /NCGR_PEP_ID=MMETSP0006_2-20121128/27880_1 /TAXON_ID=97485 /ORGANISM="Prymnesium parvum, Strain Texoma1" /LENGTH=42 /DNA_ID= /DNA_START= /DNA_END= /DNA_ORIENTATION=